MSTYKMAASNEQSAKNLQENLRDFDPKLVALSTLARKGDDKLVDRFLTENVQIEGTVDQRIQSQLYIASFWGFYDVVKNLLNNGAEVNVQNKGTGWTPLHAATFQEHGKLVMLLLEKQAHPNIPDSEGRTPKDFASASEKIWPHFAALQCKRTIKQELIEKGIIRKLTNQEMNAAATTMTGIRPGSSARLASFSRPGSAYILQRNPFSVNQTLNSDCQEYSPIGNDVLEADPSISNRDNAGVTQHVNEPTFSVWRT